MKLCYIPIGIVCDIPQKGQEVIRDIWFHTKPFQQR